MITNSSLTIYHKVLDPIDRLEKWERNNYSKVWFFGGQGAKIDKGFDNANNVDIRIPYNLNKVDISKIAIGDILVKGNLNKNITSVKELNNYETYTITSIKNNDFGGSAHVHVGGI